MLPTEGRAGETTQRLAQVHHQAGWRRGRSWTVVALAAVTAAVVVVGIGALVPRSAPAPLPGTSAGPVPPIPSGTQLVSYRGVQVFVPVAWRLDDTECGTPMHDTAIVEDGSPIPLCLVSRAPAQLTVVRVTALNTPMGRERATVASRHVTLDGHPARRGAGTPAHEQAPLSVLVLSDTEVVVSIESPNPATADRILDQVRVSAVDPYGCQARVPTLTPPRSPARAGSANRVVPGQPSGVSICRYADNRLSRSARLTPDRTAALLRILNGLPPGVSQPGPGFAEAALDCAQDVRRGFLVQFAFRSGPPVNVYVHIGGCRDLSATNGARTVEIDQALVTALTSAAGYDGGFPNPAELR